MKYTWDMLYERADGAGCGDPELKAKDTARYSAGELMIKLDYPNPEEAECPEDEISDFCDKYEVLFNQYGNVLSYRPIYNF